MRLKRAGGLIWIGIALAVSGAWSGARGGEVLQGRVIRVIDGDTVEIRMGEGGADQNRRIRLFAIDAPESKMPWGNACREKLAEVVAGKSVKVQVKDRDQYGRTVGQVFAGSRDANLAQIEAGCAWHYKQYSRKQTPGERRAYTQAEEAARAAKRGLWKEADPEAPWAFRRSLRSKSRHR